MMGSRSNYHESGTFASRSGRAYSFSMRGIETCYHTDIRGHIIFMKTNLIVGLVVGAVVIVGSGYYLMTKSSSFTGDSKRASQEQTAQAGKFSGSFASLAARGGSWKCTVDSSTAQSVSSGVTYVSGGNVRADFSTKVQGYGTVDAHVLVNGQDVYSWSSVMPKGIKTKMVAQGSGGTATSGQGMDANQAYSYDCQPWTPDASTFALPTGVSFMTVGQ